MLTDGRLFTSTRERRLWLWALVAVVAIYATLSSVPAIVRALSDRDMLDQTFFNTFLVLVVAVIVVGLSTRPTWREIAVGTAVLAVYAMAFLRFALPAERTHLFEFGVVAVLIYLALLERRSNGATVWAPGLIAVVSASVFGGIDEGIQAILPNRIFDPIDLGFNTGAALGAVLATAALRKIRSKNEPPTPIG